MKTAFVLLWSFQSLCAAVSVSTAQFDNSRVNANISETALSPSTVAPGRFGKLGSFPVDGAVYAQPLLISGVSISGAVKDILIVATMHDSIYAFDAQNPRSSALWHTSIGTSLVGYASRGTADDVYYATEVGCLSTPVVDIPNGFIYASCSIAGPNIVLYQLNLTTGATVQSVTISGSAGGATFNPVYQNQRPALTLANGNVYVGFGGYVPQNWHGWVFAYTASTLSQVGAFCTTPTAAGGGIWQAGGGFPVDANGNIYATTGDGVFDGIANFGDTILKLSPALQLLDWWTPSTYASLYSNDLDVSSGRPMLIPGTSLVLTGGKDYRVYSVNGTCMGHLQGGGSSPCPAAQVFFTNPNGPQPDQGVYGGMFLNGIGYWPNTGSLYAFKISGSTWNTTPQVSSQTSGFPGMQCSGSSNGPFNAMLWCVTSAGDSENSPSLGTVRAFDAYTFRQVWNSDQANNDPLGRLSKFAAPTVANGRVYVATQDNAVMVYGLIPSVNVRGNVTIRGSVVLR